MQRKIPEDVYRACYNLRKDSNFAIIIKWIRESFAEEQNKYTEISDDVLVRWCQGRSQVLKHILSANDDAEEILLKAEKPTPKR